MKFVVGIINIYLWTLLYLHIYHTFSHMHTHNGVFLAGKMRFKVNTAVIVLPQRNRQSADEQ